MTHSWKGLVAGAAGGLVGTFLMGLFQGAASKVMEKIQSGDAHAIEEQQKPKGDEELMSLVGRQYEEGELANEAVGRIAYEKVVGGEATDDIRPVLGEATHWAFGIGMGALYGLVRGEAPLPDFTGGIVFGTAVWIVASELMVPLLGLSPSPKEIPMSGHATHMAAHLVYGAAAAVTAQALMEYVPGMHEQPELMEASRQLAEA